MKVKHLYIALIGLLTIHSAFSQWVQTDGPYGTVKITSLFVNNDRLFASSSCGLYSTPNPSGPWNVLATIDIESYDINGNIVYFGQMNNGIKQINLSNPTTQPVNFGLEGYTLISIKYGGTCLFASDGSFFYKSTGYSSTWARETRGLPWNKFTLPDGSTDYTYPVNDIETLDNWVYSATHKGVFRADINNMVWYGANNGLPILNVQMLEEIDGILYAGVVNDLFHSTDKGDTWTRLDEAPSSISAVSRNDNQLFYSTNGSGVFTSYDDGLTWVEINTGLTDRFVTTMTFMGNTLICGTAVQGVFYYDGTTWTNNLNGMICSQIWSMTTTPTSLIASDETNVYASSGNSNLWQTITPEVAKHYFGSVASMEGKVFLAYKDGLEKQLIKYNEGNAWKDLISSPDFKSDDTYQMFTHGNTLYIYDDSYLYSTNNLGASWAGTGGIIGANSNYNDFIIFNDIPFAAKDGNSELLRLNGDNWVLSNNGLPDNKEVRSLAYSSDAIYAFVKDVGMYVSRDNGLSWTSASNGYLPGFEMRSFAYRDSSIFVSSAMGVFYSSDYGQNWKPMNEGIEGLDVGPLVIYNDSLFVGTMGHGIWKHDLDDFIPVEEIDTTVKIQQIKIFPNPASEFVRFEFDDIDKAQIRILNILGIEMINTKLGSDRQIVVSKLTNGTYVIVITTDKYSFTYKLVIQR